MEGAHSFNQMISLVHEGKGHHPNAKASTILDNSTIANRPWVPFSSPIKVSLQLVIRRKRLVARTSFQLVGIDVHVGWDVPAFENIKILLTIAIMISPSHHILKKIIFYLGPNHLRGVNIILEDFVIPLFLDTLNDMWKGKLP